MPGASFPNLQGDAGVQPLRRDLSRDKVVLAVMHLLRERKRSGAPHDRRVGDVPSEKGRKVRAIIIKFGRKRGSGAVLAGPLSVR